MALWSLLSACMLCPHAVHSAWSDGTVLLLWTPARSAGRIPHPGNINKQRRSCWPCCLLYLRILRPIGASSDQPHSRPATSHPVPSSPLSYNLISSRLFCWLSDVLHIPDRTADVLSRLSKALPAENYTTDERSFYQQLEGRRRVSFPPAISGRWQHLNVLAGCVPLYVPGIYV